MTEAIDFDFADTAAVAERRDEVVAAVESHAGRIARELALLQGGDYGQEAFNTPRGTWTVKYEGGALQYLRYEGNGGSETYVVSTKRQPDPTELATAMQDYESFVESYNDYVESRSGVLDDVSTDFPEPHETSGVVAERDRIVDRIREVCDEIAVQLHRYDGTDYGTFATTVSGTRWELKRELDRASYLRVGGEGGVYLLSQYEPPAAPDVRQLVGGFEGFVESYNDYVAELESDLDGISL
ncbi:hypothetical protein GL213_02955 [Halogeometricum borinquense]|uniref:Profilin fold domain-containing protein n=1 Tax=Halogeometricum borinquense TaxID=60847 RepID=A0A6C0UJX7_9EURY|nr:hypothetical protein [Halogeometricum borinquense]QIB75834.1 hypothetical protein G3I44_17055 [Halogeometricum borinquense]QIQ75583.1 hypothetical protein GL213_02955 [Halogeometricum borinquense]